MKLLSTIKPKKDRLGMHFEIIYFLVRGDVKKTSLNFDFDPKGGSQDFDLTKISTLSR